MQGVHQLFARLLYGTGMRLFEFAQRQIKDIDFHRREITIREGRGGKDRMMMLSRSLVETLNKQIRESRTLYELDRLYQRPGVMLPHALERKYPAAGKEVGWFWVFPSHHDSTDPRSGIMRRHHIYPQTIQHAAKRAVTSAKLPKPATTHSFHHAPATHFLEGEAAYDPCRSRLVTATLARATSICMC